MDKQKVKELIDLTVADNEFREQLLRSTELEDWNSIRMMIESLMEKYDISEMNVSSPRLAKVKIQLYKITQNLYSEFMEMYTKYLDEKEDA